MRASFQSLFRYNRDTRSFALEVEVQFVPFPPPQVYREFAKEILEIRASRKFEKGSL